jgi:hypothetical protein
MSSFLFYDEERRREEENGCDAHIVGTKVHVYLIHAQSMTEKRFAVEESVNVAHNDLQPLK